MLEHTIECAVKANLFDKIVVSTEDPEIITIADRLGVEVWERPSSLATDNSTIDEVVMHVLETHNRVFGAYPSYFCCLLATAALVARGYFEYV